MSAAVEHSQRGPRLLRGQYTAGRHTFDAEMACSRCRMTWAELQASGKDCDGGIHALAPNRRAIGERIAKRRKEAGYTQIELAQKIGVARNTVLDWEAGRARPSLERALALSRLLRESVEWLLG